MHQVLRMPGRDLTCKSLFAKVLLGLGKPCGFCEDFRLGKIILSKTSEVFIGCSTGVGVEGLADFLAFAYTGLAC